MRPGVFHPRILDPAQIEHMLHLRPVGALVMQAADKEALRNGTAVEIDCDRITRVAPVERRTMRNGSRRRRHRRPAAHHAQRLSLSFSFLKRIVARSQHELPVAQRAGGEPEDLARVRLAQMEQAEETARVLVVGNVGQVGIRASMRHPFGAAEAQPKRSVHAFGHLMGPPVEDMSGQRRHEIKRLEVEHEVLAAAVRLLTDRVKASVEEQAVMWKMEEAAPLQSAHARDDPCRCEKHCVARRCIERPRCATRSRHTAPVGRRASHGRRNRPLISITRERTIYPPQVIVPCTRPGT